MLGIFTQVCCAYLYGHLLEYFIHKHLLHNRSKKTKWFFANHFKDHHIVSRRTDVKDPKYQGWFANYLKDFETSKIFFMLIIPLPVALYFPWAYGTIMLSSLSYYVIHRRTHQDPTWARKNYPWHYEHHMGLNQNCNWGVRTDFFDKVFKTRKRYIGTDIKVADRRSNIEIVR